MNKKIKVLFVGAFSQPKGGITGGQLVACRSLLSSEISQYIDWITIDSSIESLPCPPVRTRIYKSLKRMLTLHYCLGVKKPHAALIFSASGLSLVEKGVMSLIIKIFRIPVIFAPRGSGVGRAKGILRSIFRFILSSNDMLLCQSKQWKDFYKEFTNLPETRISVLHNWIDTSVYREFPIPEERKIVNILYMGWMVKLKGIFDILEAIKRDRETFNNTRFIMCGGGVDLPNFTEKVSNSGILGLFEFPGWVEGTIKYDYLKNADIFVLPSYGEGMPNALLEAMISGKASIASRVGGIPDLITDREDGLLFNAGNIEELGQCLKILIFNRELRVKFGVRARTRALTNHSIETSWPKLLTYIQSVISTEYRK